MENNERINKLKKYQDYLEQINNYDLNNQVDSARNLLNVALSEVPKDFQNDIDVVLVLTYFYDLTKKPSFTYMTQYYQKLFNNCFIADDKINSNFDILIKIDGIQDKVIDGADNNLLGKLYEYAKENNSDNKYDGLYSKLEAECAKRNIIEIPAMSNNEVTPVDDEAFKEEMINLANQLKNPEEQTNTNTPVTDNVNNNIEENKDNDKYEDFYSNSSLKISKEVIMSMNSVNSIISTMDDNSYKRIKDRIAEKNSLNNIKSFIMDTKLGKKLIISKENNCFDKIAKCDKNVFKKIRKSAVDIKNKTKLFVDNSKESIAKAKNAIINTEKKFQEYIKRVKASPERQVEKDVIISQNANIEEKINSNQSIDDKKINSNESIADKIAGEKTFDEMYDMIQLMKKTDKDMIIEDNTINPIYNTKQLIEKNTGIDHMSNREKNNWATDSAFAQMDEESWKIMQNKAYYEENNIKEKERIEREKALAEEIIKGRTR